jgi:hypothetical protein
MARDQHAAALVGLRAQHRVKPANPGRVEALGRLVEHEDRRVAQQRGRERQALAHAERVRAHAPAGVLRKPHELEHRVGPSACDARRGGDDLEVGPPGMSRMRSWDVEDGAHRGAGRVELAVAAAVDQRPTRRRLDQPQHHADRGRLARPVRPDETRDATGRRDEGDVVDRPARAEVLRQVLAGDRAHRSRPRRRALSRRPMATSPATRPPSSTTIGSAS